MNALSSKIVNSTAHPTLEKTDTRTLILTLTKPHLSVLVPLASWYDSTRQLKLNNQFVALVPLAL